MSLFDALLRDLARRHAQLQVDENWLYQVLALRRRAHVHRYDVDQLTPALHPEALGVVQLPGQQPPLLDFGHSGGSMAWCARQARAIDEHGLGAWLTTPAAMGYLPSETWRPDDDPLCAWARRTARLQVDENWLYQVLALRRRAHVHRYDVDQLTPALHPEALGVVRLAGQQALDFGHSGGSMWWAIRQARAIDERGLGAWLTTAEATGYLPTAEEVEKLR
jgi:hypothetical protein